MISNVEHLFICLLAICILLWKNVSSGLLLTFNWVFRSNQSILKEISPGCSLEGLMLKLKLKYFGHVMRRADSLKKTLMLGKIEGRRRRGRQRMRCMESSTQWICVWVNSGSWWWTGRPGVLWFMVSLRHDWATELNWNLLNKIWWSLSFFPVPCAKEGGRRESIAMEIFNDR